MCMLRQGCSVSMIHRICGKLHGVLGWLNGVGVLGWFNGVGEIGWVFGACSIACACPFILRPWVLRKTLSHIWSKLNLPLFLFKLGYLP